MNYLQWFAAGGIALFAYTVGFYRGLSIGRVEGYRRRKALSRHVSAGN